MQLYLYALQTPIWKILVLQLIKFWCYFSGEALDLFRHELAVYGVSVHPTTDAIFASAGEDGQVLVYDTRAPPSTGL